MDFVAETNLRSLSVKDVKDAIGEALGGVGVTFIPQVHGAYTRTHAHARTNTRTRTSAQEVAPYDLPLADAVLYAGGEPLGPFSGFSSLPLASLPRSPTLERLA